MFQKALLVRYLLVEADNTLPTAQIKGRFLRELSKKKTRNSDEWATAPPRRP